MASPICLTDTAITYEGGKPVSGPIPDDLAELEHQVREQLVEGIVVGDDALMERYLDGDVPSSEELEATLATGVAQGLVFPVVCASGLTDVGVDRLATLLAEVAPAPSSRPPAEVLAGESMQEVPVDPAGAPLARVFKTISDPYVGKISLLRVLSGTIRPDTVLTNPRTHSDERLHVLQLLRGKDADTMSEAQAGDLVAVPKLSDTTTGDTLAPKGTPVRVPRPEPEPPALAIAIRPKSKGDEDKLMTGLHRLQEEDTALVVERVDETHQTIFRGTGETHLTVTCDRLHRKFGVEVETEDVRIAYRETISKQSEAEGKYKKQTGGHGQYGVASIRIDPLERGEGFHFVDQVVGGAIPKQYIPAVEKGVIEAMSQGGVFGFPVVDVQVACYDGKYHCGLLGDELQDGGRTRLSRGHGGGRTGTARTGGTTRGHRARVYARRRSRRPQLAPWARAGHRHRGGRPADDHRPGPHRRDRPLRRGPALAHRWTRALSQPSTTITTWCPPPSPSGWSRRRRR